MNYKALIPVIATLYGCSAATDLTSLDRGLPAEEKFKRSKTACQTLRVLEEDFSLEELAKPENTHLFDQVFESAFRLQKDTLGEKSCGLKRKYKTDEEIYMAKGTKSRTITGCGVRDCEFVKEIIPLHHTYAHKKRTIKGSYRKF